MVAQRVARIKRQIISPCRTNYIHKSCSRDRSGANLMTITFSILLSTHWPTSHFLSQFISRVLEGSKSTPLPTTHQQWSRNCQRQETIEGTRGDEIAYHLRSVEMGRREVFSYLISTHSLDDQRCRETAQNEESQRNHVNAMMKRK